MADETGDDANVEQLVICLRWVGDGLQIHEDFIDLHSMELTDAESIVRVIEISVFIRIKLFLEYSALMLLFP